MSKMTEEVVNRALTHLASAPNGIHYLELTVLMLEAGWVPTQEFPDRVVYACLYHSARNDQGIVFLGKGMFALKGPNYQQSVLPRGTVKATSKSTAILSESRRCGNCRYINYGEGAQAITWESGDCSSERSGRPYVRPEESACCYWSKRTEAQINADIAKRVELRIIVEAVNHCAQRGRTWESVSKLRR
jgi:hypothetical protein